MNIESTIKEGINKLKKEGSTIYISPDIPSKKLDNAIGAYANNVQPGYVLALVDTTLFRSAKEGMLFLGDKFYLSYGKKEINYLDIQSVELSKNYKTAKDGTSVEVEPSIILHLKDETSITMDNYLIEINREAFKDFIQTIIDTIGTDTAELDSTNQTLPLSMMSDEIKELYMKIICNTAYNDDEEIDSREYAEIMTLIAINSLTHESRMKLRAYIYDTANMEKMDSLLKKLEELVPAGSFETIRLSLLKDIVNIRWDEYNQDTAKEEAKEDDYIKGIQKQLDINEDKAGFIIDEIQNNKDILNKRQNDDQIKNSFNETIARAGAVGVPMAAVYLSGSVLGVSAAGITSGLATLGMGGVLGFSSMFTGIGVAVLIGVGAYKGVRKFTGLEDLEKNKERELMLKEIATNAQKTLNYLVEDINEINDQLQHTLFDQELLNEKSTQLARKLAKLMGQMGKGAAYTTGKMGFATKEQVICKLPHNINVDVLEKLSGSATQSEARELLMKVYSKQESDDKDKVVNYCLDTNCTEKELANAYNALEQMGYFKLADNTIAAARSAADNSIKEVKNFMKGFMN